MGSSGNTAAGALSVDNCNLDRLQNEQQKKQWIQQKYDKHAQQEMLPKINNDSTRQTITNKKDNEIDQQVSCGATTIRNNNPCDQVVEGGKSDSKSRTRTKKKSNR